MTKAPALNSAGAFLVSVGEFIETVSKEQDKSISIIRIVLHLSWLLSVSVTPLF